MNIHGKIANVIFNVNDDVSVDDAKKIAEESKVSIRAIRRDGMDEAKSLQKEALMTEDELKKAEEQIQKLTDKKIAEIDVILEKKEKEIMSI